MIRLVVNADNLGESAAADSAIIRAHREGIVTSCSLLGNAPGGEDSRKRLRDCPNLGVGIALSLTGGSPVASAAEVPSLLGSDGMLRRDPIDFAGAWVAARIGAAEVERELAAQIARAVQIGFELDHLSTHAHIGFLPGVARIVENLARRFDIPGVRASVEPPTLGWVAEPRRALRVGVLGGLAWLARKQMGARAHGPASWGYLEAGRLDEVRILELIGRMGPGAHELICQPSRELAALTSAKVRASIEQRQIILCRWRDLF